MKTILIIDDDVIVTQLCGSVFKSEGFDVAVAVDGKKGLAMIEKKAPDLVLMDLLQPKMDGVDIIKKIRKIAGAEDLPIVVLYNEYLNAQMTKAIEAGATCCLDKSTATPELLVKTVATVFAAAEVKTAGAKSVAPAAPRVHAHYARNVLPEVHRSFFLEVGGIITHLRDLYQALPGKKGRAQADLLMEIYSDIRTLASKAALAEVLGVAHFASALEGFAKELTQTPSNVTPSALNTLRLSIDFLDETAKPGHPASERYLRAANILAVDDDTVSRIAVRRAVEAAQLKAVCVGKPETAMELLWENTFDLIILDVEMPGMNGFEMCQKIRSMSTNRTTPVVFVTSMSDFESRARSTVSGGNDYITKPFLKTELAVKTLIFLQKKLSEKAVRDDKNGG